MSTRQHVNTSTRQHVNTKQSDYKTTKNIAQTPYFPPLSETRAQSALIGQLAGSVVIGHPA